VAHVLRVTNGTTTVNLTGGPITLAQYTPRSPETTVEEATAWALEDGGEVFAVAHRNVAEPIELTIVDSTTALVRAKVNALEMLLEEAAERQRRRIGSRVYVEFQPGASGDIYRSELLYGRLELGNELLGMDWRAPGARALLSWKRRFYWEGPQSELPLANGNGSGTGGRTIHNHDDGGAGHDNYVAIDGDDVEGVLPAPIRLEITNTYNQSTRTWDVYVGQNIWSSPGSLDHIIEAEDRDYVAGSASPQSDGSCSGGYKQPSTWPVDAQTLLLRFDLSTALLGACAGNYFRLLARFPTDPPETGCFIQPKITFPSGTPITVVAEGREIELNDHTLQSLGVMQIPPWLPGETSLYPVDLCIYGRQAGGGTLVWDYIQLTPLDGWRALIPRGYGAEYQIRIVDDGIAGSIWTDGWSGSQKTGHYLGRGRPIHLWPGRDQRLYFLAGNSNQNSEIARTHSIRAYYRPRRLTL